MKTLLKNRELSAVFAIVALFAVLVALNPAYFSLKTLAMIFASSQILCLLALGATLGAIVIVAVYGMFKWHKMVWLYRVRRLDFWLAMVALLGVLTFEEVLVGLLIAVVVSLLALVVRSSRPEFSVLGRAPGHLYFEDVHRHPESIQPPGVRIILPNEGIFFANAAPLREAIVADVTHAAEPVQTIILDLELSNDLDAPGAEMLADLAALHAGPAERAEIATCAARCREAADWRGYEAWDNRLHDAVARATRNRLLIHLFRTMNAVRRSMAWHQPRATPGPAPDYVSFLEHDAIIAAIERRDGNAAAALMRAHLVSVRDRILPRLERPPLQGPR